MATTHYVQAQVLAEITRESRAVRFAYVREFGAEANEFASIIGAALHECIGHLTQLAEHEPRRRVYALAYTTLAMQVNSMKLLLSGHTVAAGNVFRQVIELIALTLLCSGRGMSFLDRFEQDRYSTKNAVRDLRNNADRLHVRRSSLGALERAQTFYSKFSHPTKLTIGAFESFAGEGIYFGASFDQGKLRYYRQEVTQRLKLARVIPTYISLTSRNLAAW